MKYSYYASDILHAAMELAQSKALNSYSYRDCMNWLTELWQNCYERVAQIDEGYYSTTVRLTERLTHLPPFVRNTIKVYAARDKVDVNRRIYRASSYTDLTSYYTYHISGLDLYCPDAINRIVWLEFVPEPPFITFTKNNRDPKVLSSRPSPLPPGPWRYGGYSIDFADDKYIATSLYDTNAVVDITHTFVREGYSIIAIIFDCPYVFISYKDNATGDWSSYIMNNVIEEGSCIQYNPFSYQGRGSRVKYLACRYNDDTGMGAIIEDQETGRVLELGWTPDTLMDYPSPILRNYMVAHLAKRFAGLNNSQLDVINDEIASADYQMANFLARDKSAWRRFDRVVGPSLGDML